MNYISMLSSGRVNAGGLFVNVVELKSTFHYDDNVSAPFHK